MYSHAARRMARCVQLPSRAAQVHLFRRSYTVSGIAVREQYHDDFKFWPSFFSPAEQRIVLAAALLKLDGSESKKHRQRRKVYVGNRASSSAVTDLFFPDEYYDFHEGHYDGVIHHYREMHLTSWPEAEIGGLRPVLDRLYSLCPAQDTQTHLLHLASHGEILPHIDNIHASGSWILGLSLGSEWTLKLENSQLGDSFRLTLPSGSVYLQRNRLRYDYKHSVFAPNMASMPNGQRLSVIVRDLPAKSDRNLTYMSPRGN